jgi:hypothetical protein
MKNDTAITSKIVQLRDDIAAIEAGERIVIRIGGLTSITENREKTFQQRRLGWLEWAQVSAEDAIRDRMQTLWNAMDNDERIIMASGHIRFVPQEIIDRIAEYSLLQLALGEHPAQQG